MIIIIIIIISTGLSLAEGILGAHSDRVLCGHDDDHDHHDEQDDDHDQFPITPKELKNLYNQ